MQRKIIIIADSGATKTDWALADQSSDVRRVKTKGINPFTQSEDSIRSEISAMRAAYADILHEAEQVSVAFYGAGCVGEKALLLSRLLSEELKPTVGKVNVEVNTDLLAAARALCGRERGVACILGTGANSCLYDGVRIVANTPPLGYILGDEGSGAYLGRQFLRGIFKGRLSKSLRDDFLSTTGLTYEEIISRVYRQPMPNRFLASVMTYLNQHHDNPDIQALIKDGFLQFLSWNVAPYGQRDMALNFTGGVAYSCRDILAEACQEAGYKMGKVMAAPMDGLLEYHAQDV